jgi:hypothetical protein
MAAGNKISHHPLRSSNLSLLTQTKKSLPVSREASSYTY